ncbi:guanylate kinase [Peptoniphilus catoniae]|uniref:guanylate kinase n=1 Tax=Peptoniphilus catoniae TaxID=1660341 RepID=UPI0010FE1A42|nr:AAA family ATPase [Peptoniphilus catoniae]
MIYLIAGCSGSGKTTQGNILKKKKNFHRIITYTTRPKREGEVDGIDYHFITREDFRSKSGKKFFIAETSYAGNLYGISKKELEKYNESRKNIILILELKGVAEIKKTFKNSICIYLRLSEEEMIRRMKKRGDSPEKVANRLKSKQDFLPYADYVIDASKSIDEVAKNIEAIVEEQNKNNPTF